ncbi:MAG TPA: hypothetical protein VLX11_01400 [Candidatus Acidoferrales bacterium]|nr:hypothetical protein [Candidatus Acidoferrales bacterium]
MLQTLAMFSGILMPFFNIPLIIRIVRRRSSRDISLLWAVGVWFCVIAMLPHSLQSPEPVLLGFGVVNALFFTGVLLTVLYFHPSLKKRSVRSD